MRVGLTIACATAAAALFAVASAVQSRALREAGTAFGPAAGRSAPTRRELAAALSSGMWRAGAVISVVAFGLHAIALHDGDLTLVQPLLVTAVLFALPASRVMGGPAITAADVAWAAVLVIGLSAFFVAADPLSRSSSSFDRGPAIFATVLALAVIGGCVALARRRGGSESAALLGAGAGVAFAGVAAFVKATTGLISHGPMRVVTSWELYAALAAGAAGIVLSQLAFRAGPLSASVPAMNSINPLVSVLIGIVVFDDKVRSGPVPSTAQSVALVAVTAATVWLSRTHRLEPESLRPVRSGRAGTPA